MVSVTNWEDMRFGLIEAFYNAIVEVRKEWGTAEAEVVHMAAFDLATKYGWDSHNDEPFMHWCLKATQEEILAEALAKALEHCRPA